MMRLAINQPFDLALSLEMGQAFRWRRVGDEGLANRDWGRPPARWRTGGGGWYSGVIGQHLIHIRQTAEGVEYRAGGPDGEIDADLSELLSGYFRLDDDVEAIYQEISRDERMTKLVDDNRGMRILRQEPWECLTAYICSANNNIRRISAIVETIADTFGQSIELDGDIRRTFPMTGELLDDSTAPEKLAGMNLGLQRASNIIAAARQVCAGELDLYALRRQPYLEVRRILMQGSGIGPKIADCVALFALDQLEAFPVDTHIRRELNERYFHAGKMPSDAQIVRWAHEHFGHCAGYAGQFLFRNRPK